LTEQKRMFKIKLTRGSVRIPSLNTKEKV